MTVDVVALFERYYEDELDRLRRRVRCPNDAEDILGDAYLKILSYTEKYPDREIEKPRPWLRKIVNNCLTDHYRFWARRGNIYDDGADLLASHDGSGEDRLVDDTVAVDWIDQDTDIEYIDRVVVTDMPRRDQCIFYLRLNGYRFSQIADALGMVSASAARSAYYRLKIRLEMRLSCREQIILFMRLNGYSFDDIADALGMVSAGSARGVLHRYKQRINLLFPLAVSASGGYYADAAAPCPERAPLS